MRADRAWAFMRFCVTSIALFSVWILFTADLGAFSLIVGAVGASGIAAYTFRIFLADHDVSFRFFVPRPLALAKYVAILVATLYASSVRVLFAVISGRTNPKTVYFRTRLKSDVARMVLANSISLTPGTVVVDLDDDHLTVHWLFASTRHSRAAGDEIKGELERALGSVWI